MSRIINEKIAEDTQKFEYGINVELFDIDTSPTGDGNGPYYICNNITENNTLIYFNSIPYTPIDYKFEGYGMVGEGKLARPTFSISNVSRTFATLINQFNGLVGTIITRRRTRSEYLDGQPEADSAAQMPVEVYIVSKIEEYNKIAIKWQLVAPIDREDKLLPARQAWKDFCPFYYRIWKNGVFDYTNVIDCPYTGSNYFNRYGEAEGHGSNDFCGKRLSDCRLRFPTGVVPFGGFPGMSEVRL